MSVLAEAAVDLTASDAPIPPPEPPAWSSGEQAWVLSRHADVLSVLRTRQARGADPGIDLGRVVQRTGRHYPDLQAILAGTQLFQEGDPHRRTRAMVRRFVADLTARWTPPAVRDTARAIVDALPRDAVVDIVSVFADRLPATIAAAALGLSLEQVRRFRLQGHAVMEIWRPAPPLRDYARLDALCREIHADLAPQTAPGGCLCRLDTGASDHTTSDLAFWLVTAAVDTIAGTLAASLDLLAHDPALQDCLRANPVLIRPFVQESLRLAGPLRRLNRRIALAPLQVGGTMVRPGDGMILHIERAHRDPATFPAPDHIDLTRSGQSLLAFGGGMHACQGSLMGALQAEVMLETLLPEITVRPAAERGALVPHPDLRQFASLPLMLRDARGRRS